MEKFRYCLQSLEYVHGHHIDFSKTLQKKFQNLKKSAFLDLHKNELHHLDPIFMPFPKWCITFLYLKN